MARNPWLTISPIKNIASSSPEGNKLVLGTVGKIISWLWLLGSLALLIYGYFILWRQNNLERLIANLAIVVIASNWLISLMTIGDHRFRIPIMGMSIFLQSIGIRKILGGKKFRMQPNSTF
jgi:hypothetical protein